jgi:transposase InsO family protein
VGPNRIATVEPNQVDILKRFHQTMKKYLAQQDGIETRKQLQVQLARFVTYYNEVRPHRAIGRKTPMRRGRRLVLRQSRST